MERDAKIFIAGSTGLVGSAIRRRLTAAGFTNLPCVDRSVLDLTEQAAVRKFFSEQRVDYVFLAAGRVGGIQANMTYPAEFIYENMMIAANVIHSAYETGVRKLLNLGSSCIYPRLGSQPLTEGSLLAGPLEPTNEAYAVAKISAIKLCQSYRDQHGCDFISAMPTNLYGPGDNFDLETSHVVPALLRKVHEAMDTGASQVAIWGSGKPRREFLYVDDLADACLHLMNRYDDRDIINVGSGEDVTVAHLAETIRDVVGFRGSLVFDSSKPDGMPRKLLDVSRINSLGWRSTTSLRDGLARTYDWYRRTAAVGAGRGGHR